MKAVKSGVWASSGGNLQPHLLPLAQAHPDPGSGQELLGLTWWPIPSTWHIVGDQQTFVERITE